MSQNIKNQKFEWPQWQSSEYDAYLAPDPEFKIRRKQKQTNKKQNYKFETDISLIYGGINQQLLFKKQYKLMKSFDYKEIMSLVFKQGTFY